jgi:hypothetical protein
LSYGISSFTSADIHLMSKKIHRFKGIPFMRR